MSDSILDDMDLEPIMVKIMDSEEGLGWSLDFTKRVAQEGNILLYAKKIQTRRWFHHPLLMTFGTFTF